MVRKRNEMKAENRGVMYEGKGEVELTHLLRAEDFHEKGRLFAKLSLPVGGEIGRHVHEGEFETFYVLRGEGVFDDNGVETNFSAGDILYTPKDSGHGVRNTGAEPVELLALILYA